MTERDTTRKQRSGRNVMPLQCKSLVNSVLVTVCNWVGGWEGGREGMEGWRDGGMEVTKLSILGSPLVNI